MGERAKSRSFRKTQIILLMRVRTEKNRFHIASAVNIAKSIGLVPSAHLRKIINELVDTGELVAEDVLSKSAVPYRRYYRLPPNDIARPRKERTIAINHNGKPAGHIDMFPELSHD